MQQQPTQKQPQIRRRESATVPRPIFYCALLILLVAAGVIVGVVVHNQPTSPPPSSLASLHSLQSSENERVTSRMPKFSTHLKFQKRSEQEAQPSPTTEEQQPAATTEKPKKPAKPHHFYHDKKKTDKDKEELGAKKNKKQ